MVIVETIGLLNLKLFIVLSYCVLNHYDLTNQCYRQNTLTNTGGHMHARAYAQAENFISPIVSVLDFQDLSHPHDFIVLSPCLIPYQCNMGTMHIVVVTV